MGRPLDSRMEAGLVALVPSGVIRMVSKHGPLFSAPTANLSPFMDALGGAVVLARDRVVRCGPDPVRPFSARDEAVKGDFIVSEFVRVGVLEREAVGRLVDMVVGGASVSERGIEAMRDLVSEWMSSRALRFKLSKSSVEARLMARRIPVGAALVVESAMRELAARVCAAQVGAVPLPRRRGSSPVPSSDYLLRRASWSREIADPQVVVVEAERAIVEARDAIRRIKRRAADAARLAKPGARRRKT